MATAGSVVVDLLLKTGSFTTDAARAEKSLQNLQKTASSAATGIGKAFEAKGAKAKVRFSFAASSALAKQMEAGAPASIFASADLKWMDYVEQKGLIAREPVKRDARLKKIVLTDKSRHIAEVLRDNAKNMERILLEGLEDDQIRQFMHVLDVMQTNLVKTGLIGDESRYSSLEIQEQDFGESQVSQKPQVSQESQESCDGRNPHNRDSHDEYVSRILRMSQEMAIANNLR